MSDYPIDTWVEIDGVQAHDSAEDLKAGRPTLMDGLSFGWGRSSQHDQAEPGSLTFQVREQLLDGEDPGNFLDVVSSGKHVEVWARAGGLPPESNEVMTDTGFSVNGILDPSRWAWLGSAPSGLEVRVLSRFGRRAAWTRAIGNYAWSGTVMFAPRPWAPDGEMPGDWDYMPRLLPGQSWEMKITGLLPANTQAQIAAVAFTDPHRSGATAGQRCRVYAVDDDGISFDADYSWNTLRGRVMLPADFTDPSGAWIAPAIHYSVMPDRTTWEQTPGDWTEQERTWLDRQRAAINHVSLTQTTDTAREVLVWGGEVTDATASAAGDKAVQIDVTAIDPGAALENNTIGDTPWPVQSVADRTQRIMELARTNRFSLIVDDGLNDVLAAGRDVDAQPVLGLLQDLATTAGGALWVAQHATAGTFVWMEDGNARAAVRKLIIGADGRVTIGGSTREVAFVSASDLLRDPISFSQNAETMISTVDVQWLEETVDEENETVWEERTVTVTDDESADDTGLRKLAVQTELTTEQDAFAYANRALAQAQSSTWKVDGLTIDTRVLQRPIPEIDDVPRLQTILDLLDGTRRNGHAVTLLDLPSWTPTGAAQSVYLEGGTYRLESGRWVLELTGSPAGGQGESVTWEQIPTSVKWTDLDESIRWIDLYGTAAPVAPEALKTGA